MIYITGDTHGEFGKRFSVKNFEDQRNMTKDDYLIVCGDFSGVFEKEETKNEKNWLDWFNDRNYTLLFVDGNHENFNRLNTFPEKEWHGGRVHEIRPSVLHLMRGQVFEIDGKKIFTFGGAQSHDVDAGILDPEDPLFKEKKKMYRKEYVDYRVKNESWWEEEMPTKEEMEEGMANLEKHNLRVDYIITHCCATSTQNQINPTKYKANALTKYFERIKNTVEYEHWYFGHYHDTWDISEEEHLLYEEIRQA